MRWTNLVAAMVSVVWLSTFGCTTQSVVSVDKSTPVVQVVPADLEEPVAYLLPADQSLLLTSADGALGLRVWARTVNRDTQLTVARLIAGKTPKGVVGSAYLLTPDFTGRRPVRLTIELAPPAQDPSRLRLARLDTGGRYYQPLDGAATPISVGTPEEPRLRFAAVIERMGVFGVVDLDAIAVREDIAATPSWTAEHLLDVGRIAEARDQLQAAYDAQPSPSLAIPLAITRLLQLPALPAFTDLMLDCGQPVWDDAAVFGPAGYFAQRAGGRGQGSDVIVGEGFSVDAIIRERLHFTGIRARAADFAICLDYNDARELPAGYLELSASASLDESGDGLGIDLVLDPTAPSLADGAMANSDGTWDVDVASLNGGLRLLTTGLRQVTDWASAHVGDYEPLSGSLHLTFSSAGAPVSVRFDDVVFGPTWPEDPPRTFILSGELTTTWAQPPSTTAIPLADVVETADLVAACQSPLDEARLQASLAAAGEELRAIADLLESVLADPGAADLRYDLSLGFLWHPGSVTLGPVEVGVLATAVNALIAVQEVVAAYHWFGGDLRDLVTNGTRRGEWQCPSACDRTACSPGEDAAVLTVDSDLFAAAADSIMLTYASDAPSLVGARDHLDTALALALDALSGSTPGTLFAFDRPELADGVGIIVGIGEQIRAALLAETLADAVLIDFMPGILFTLGGLFTAPPDQAALRAVSDPAAAGAALDVSADTSMDCGGGRSSQCQADCTTLADVQCGCMGVTAQQICAAANPYERSVGPAGWVLQNLMQLVIHQDVACNVDADCPAAGTCSTGTCSYSQDAIDAAAFDAFMAEGRNIPFVSSNGMELLDAIQIENTLGGASQPAPTPK